MELSIPICHGVLRILLPPGVLPTEQDWEPLTEMNLSLVECKRGYFWTGRVASLDCPCSEQLLCLHHRTERTVISNLASYFWMAYYPSLKAAEEARGFLKANLAWRHRTIWWSKETCDYKIRLHEYHNQSWNHNQSRDETKVTENN